MFNGIKNLFKGKPIVFVMTKTDLKSIDDLDSSDKALIDEVTKENNGVVLSMSNEDGNGVFDVKKAACEILQKYRAGLSKEVTTGGLITLQQEEDYLKGIFVAYPKKIDNKTRPPTIPEAIKQGKPLALERPTLKEEQEKHGGAGVYHYPLQNHFMLEDSKWKFDQVPEIMDGKNVADFYDPQIMKRLEELEKEEAILEAQFLSQADEKLLDDDFMQAYQEVQTISKRRKMHNKLKAQKRMAHKKMDLPAFKTRLTKKGINPRKVIEKLGNKRRGYTLVQRHKEDGSRIDAEDEGADDEMVVEGSRTRKMVKRTQSKRRSLSRTRTVGHHPASEKLNKVREERRRRAWFLCFLENR